jgi:hypothetical protein
MQLIMHAYESAVSRALPAFSDFSGAGFFFSWLVHLMSEATVKFDSLFGTLEVTSVPSLCDNASSRAIYKCKRVSWLKTVGNINVLTHN